MFGPSVVFPSGLATSGQASRLPAARPLARGGVSVMATFAVFIIGNRCPPFLWWLSIIIATISIKWGFDCARSGAICLQPHATVSGMNGSVLEAGLAGCYELMTIFIFHSA
jgi:hypothetical protein